MQRSLAVTVPWGLQRGVGQSGGSLKGCSALRVSDKDLAALQSRVTYWWGQGKGSAERGYGKTHGEAMPPPDSHLWKLVIVIILAFKMAHVA